VPNQNIINLYDRIKELTYITGVTDISLAGAANGFSPFRSVYSHNDPVIYAITDGTSYEIGSGVLLLADYDLYDGISEYDIISERTVISSSNDNDLVSFPPGTKEVYVTYPATHAVMMGSGLGDLQVPQRKGIAIWDSENILNYDANIVWDRNLKTLGLQNITPTYGIDLGGSGDISSAIRASGYYVGSTGIYFQAENGDEAEYPGGTQFQHFEKNRLDDYAHDEQLIGQLTGSANVLELSGVVNQYILFKKQNAGHVFAGPPSGCTPPCSPAYPSFRPLELLDIPDLTSIYATFVQLTNVSGALNTSLNNRITSVSGALQTQQDDAIEYLEEAIASGESRLTDYITAVSGELDDFITSSSGYIQLVSGVLQSGINEATPIYKIISSHEIPIIGGGDLYTTTFNVSGIISGVPYAITVTPSKALDPYVILSYSYPSGNNNIATVFYNTDNQSSSATTQDFYITAKRVY
jgi:hypothetical protein